jgi:toxin ParE1/3/4
VLLKGSVFLADYAGVVADLAAVNPDAADRFCDAVEAALDLLAQHPQLGSLAGFPQAPSVRKWVLSEFRNYIVFYEARGEEVILVRLLHGARQLAPLIPISS